MDWFGVATVAAFAASLIQLLCLAYPDGVIRRG